MIPCPDKALMLHGLLDGELDATNALAVEAHVRTCPGCAAELERLQALGRLVRAPGVAYATPPGLAHRVEAALGGKARPARSRLWTVAPWGVSGAMAALAAGFALVMIQPGGHERVIESEVIAGHIRSLQANHLVDVETSDRHTVKPWFNGKVDFAPPVIDLASAGYPLGGGRLDYLHGRTVAAVVYRRRGHAINLFVWRAGAGERPSGEAAREGYDVVYWTKAGLEFWAVSDIDPKDLEAFAHAYRSAT